MSAHSAAALGSQGLLTKVLVGEVKRKAERDSGTAQAWICTSKRVMDNPGPGSFRNGLSVRQTLALSRCSLSCCRSHRAGEEPQQRFKSREKTPSDERLRLLHPRVRAETWGLQHPREQRCPLRPLGSAGKGSAGSHGRERKPGELKLELIRHKLLVVRGISARKRLPRGTGREAPPRVSARRRVASPIPAASREPALALLSPSTAWLTPASAASLGFPGGGDSCAPDPPQPARASPRLCTTLTSV